MKPCSLCQREGEGAFHIRQGRFSSYFRNTFLEFCTVIARRRLSAFTREKEKWKERQREFKSAQFVPRSYLVYVLSLLVRVSFWILKPLDKIPFSYLYACQGKRLRAGQTLSSLTDKAVCLFRFSRIE